MRKKPAQIIAAAKTIDNHGDLGECLQLEQRIRAQGIELHELIIEPLAANWHAPLPQNHFRSGCAPIDALEHAVQLIHAGAEAVLIRGEDPLKSGYTRAERLERMAIYGASYPLTQAYTELAEHFIAKESLTDEDFYNHCDALFRNHLRSLQAQQAASQVSEPDARWFKPVTRLFRGVDCANPIVDFSGRLLITSHPLAEELGIQANKRLNIAAVATHALPEDGKDKIPEIADYQHLRQIYKQCCKTAGINFNKLFLESKALMEVYTCYPVVPMGFLISTGLVEDLKHLPDFLAQHSITVTGGMNLARAPWNNPALNALITMHHRLLEGPERWGLVHGNGGLGYRQGVAIIRSNL